MFQLSNRVPIGRAVVLLLFGSAVHGHQLCPTVFKDAADLDVIFVLFPT